MLALLAASASVMLAFSAHAAPEPASPAPVNEDGAPTFVLQVAGEGAPARKTPEAGIGAAAARAKAAAQADDSVIGDEVWLMLAALTGLGFALRRRSAL